MSMYFMILFYFSWRFKFTLCKHARLSYVFLINLLTYLLTYYSLVRRTDRKTTHDERPLDGLSIQLLAPHHDHDQKYGTCRKECWDAD